MPSLDDAGLSLRPSRPLRCTPRQDRINPYLPMLPYAPRKRPTCTRWAAVVGMIGLATNHPETFWFVMGEAAKNASRALARSLLQAAITTHSAAEEPRRAFSNAVLHFLLVFRRRERLAVFFLRRGPRHAATARVLGSAEQGTGRGSKCSLSRRIF